MVIIHTQRCAADIKLENLLLKPMAGLTLPLLKVSEETDRVCIGPFGLVALF